MAYGSSTVDRAIDVLTAVTASPCGLTNVELCEQLGIERSAAHRLVTTLERRGLVSRVDGRRLVGGPALTVLATGTVQNLYDTAAPTLAALVALTGESASISILSGETFSCVAHQTSPHELSYTPITGKQYPLHTGAAGLALWAFQAEPIREKLTSTVDLVAITGKTITDNAALRAELDATVERGYGQSSGVRTPGGCSIAMPVFGLQGSVAAALALSAAEARMSLDRLATFAPHLRAHADVLGHALGWRP